MTTQTQQNLLEILIENGLADEEKIIRAETLAGEKKQSLELALIEQGVPRLEVLKARSREVGFDFIELEKKKLNQEIVEILPEAMCRRYNAVCVGKTETGLTLAMADPLDVFALDDLRLRTGYQIAPLVAIREEILQQLDDCFKKEDLRMILDQVVTEKGEDIAVKAQKNEDDEKEAVVDTPIIRFVDRVIIDAINQRASDIHIEPFENEVSVRYRIDGVLRETMKYPRGIHNSVISRIKIISDLKIDERRVPQDGRIQIKLGVSKRVFDIRVSTLPTILGESVVMRLLDRSGIKIELKQIGFAQGDFSRYDDIISHPHGIILVTGPTGSGKSTTLYATLNCLNQPGVKILTIEDPVEYNLKGVVQVQTNAAVGLNFATGLRTFLRQDPDIIMVGEIRDRETAMIASQAALTGHLVLSTLHTNDAVTALTRLQDMGVEPFLLSSTVLGILAQRLVRMICQNCKTERELAPEEKSVFAKYDVPVPEKVYCGKGCDICGKSGYKGRMGIYELFTINEEIREMILKQARPAAILEAARKLGMKSLMEDGLAKIAQGSTTFEEVYRVTKE